MTKRPYNGILCKLLFGTALQLIHLRGKNLGGIAQLGEHLPCKQGVSGSIPLISTNKIKSKHFANAKCFDLTLKEVGSLHLEN